MSGNSVQGLHRFFGICGSVGVRNDDRWPHQFSQILDTGVSSGAAGGERIEVVSPAAARRLLRGVQPQRKAICNRRDALRDLDARGWWREKSGPRLFELAPEPRRRSVGSKFRRFAALVLGERLSSERVQAPPQRHLARARGPKLASRARQTKRGRPRVLQA